MGRTTRRGAALLAAPVLAATLLVACTPVTVQTTKVPLTVACGGGTNLDALWAFPEGVTPSGVVWLQHGFSRSNAAVTDLARTLAGRGLVVVAPTVSSFGTCSINAEALHQAIATALAAWTPLQASANAARAKLGLPPATLPAGLVVAGHSAGGALATVVGGKLASSVTPTTAARLRGVLLLDPVENSGNGMQARLPQLAGKPVLTVSAGDSSCNSNSSGTKALVAARGGFVGVRLPSGCHCDAEADSTDALCTLVCGTPKTQNEDALKKLAGNWALDMVKGVVTADTRPGGAWYEAQRTAGVLVTLTGSA